MVVLPSSGVSRYHNWCIDGGSSPEYFGFNLVLSGDMNELRYYVKQNLSLTE
jgi:hypothetical protein